MTGLFEGKYKHAKITVEVSAISIVALRSSYRELNSLKNKKLKTVQKITRSKTEETLQRKSSDQFPVSPFGCVPEK